MSRSISFNAHLALDDGLSTAESEIALVRFTSPDGTYAVRVATGATERITTEPLVYGVRSTWLGSNPATQPFVRLLMAAQLPDDKDEGQGQVRLTLDMVDATMIEVLRSFTDRATVDLAVVLAATPNLIEFEQLGMVLVGAEGQGGQVSLTITADPVTEEDFPSGRMTRQRFPGLFA